MAENPNSDNQFVWNFEEIPVTVRAQGNIGNVMHSLIPEIQRRINNNPFNRQPQQQQGANDNQPRGHVTSSHSHSHGHSHAHSHGNSHGHQATASTMTTTSHPSNNQNVAMVGGNPNSFVVNMGAHGNAGNTPNMGTDENLNFDQNHGQQPHSHTQPQANQEQNPRQVLQTLWKVAQGWLPFVLLLMVKVLYNHRLGILTFIGLSCTFYHANSVLVRQIAQRELRGGQGSVLYLLWVLAFTTINTLFVYYVFEGQQLYKNLYMFLPGVDVVDLWNLLWVLGITSFILKFATISLKTLIAIMPRWLVRLKRRGKYYMFLEHLSQFYQSVVPISAWISFLINDTQGGRLFSTVLVILYTLCKGHSVTQKAMDTYKAFRRFLVDSSYGSSPSADEVSEQGVACPICQDEFKDPIMLSCKHIFCEDCVSMWFDREKTCPMCRAKIVDNVVYRDGSTSPFMNLF